MRIALVLLLVAFAGIVFAKKDYDHEWEKWKSDFGKNFKTPEEEAEGKENFKKHDAEIDQQNELFAQGKSSWKAAHNHHSHLSHAALSKRNGFKKMPHVRTKRDLAGPEAFGSNLPTFYTYTANPATVTISDASFNTTLSEPVQDQGQCGNCYSFAGGSMLSGHKEKYYALKLVFSRQEIVDCSTYLGNGGCNGGDPRAVLEYYILNKTVVSSQYTFIYYTPSNDSTIPTEACQTQKRTGTLYGIDTTTYNMMDINPDELSLKSTLKNCGVMAVTIYADPALNTYSSGIFTCPTSGQNDHAVTLIGWGQNSSGKKYWIIKNSWGKSWGMAGYFQLAFGSCGITGSTSSVAASICAKTFS